VGRRRRHARRAERETERRAGREARPEPVAVEEKRSAKVEQRRREKYEQDRRRLVRRRTVIGAIGFVPLLASLFNVPFGPLDFLGMSPRDGWLLVWAALFGSFLGLTIRLVLERRRFERGAASGRTS
jgi:hypothetical protein